MLYSIFLTKKNLDENKIILQKVKIGDLISFGRYQICNSSKPYTVHIEAPIVWQVLDKQGSKLLLISKYNLYWEFFDGSGSFFEDTPKVGWRESTIREDLNSDFYNECFDDLEKSLIITSKIKTECNPVYNDDNMQSYETDDKVFLLSFNEVIDYFFRDKKETINDYLWTEDDEAWYLMQNSATDAILIFADESGHNDELEAEISLENHEWWLRTDGYDPSTKMVVEPYGQINIDGMENGCDEVGVRPAMWIDADNIDSIRHKFK